MSNMTEQIVNMIDGLQKSLTAQLELNQSLMRRINLLEEQALQTGDAVLKLLKEQHGGSACGRHCACKAGEM